ncbi:MAG TPA: YneF family protein [Bacilli bacterium]|nr:YneF family protein [Bacilli bacterium]
MPIGAAIGLAVFALVLGAVLGYLISRKVFEKQLKKNPPITEKQIRTMLTMMGRKPSEKQVREIMRGMQQS